jgi:hypothetical protein
MALILDLSPVILERVDTVRNPSLNTSTLTLHTTTVLAACCIITRNTHGSFALEKDPTVAIQNRAQAEFLDVHNVFYHTNDPNTPAKYPICSLSSTSFAPGAASQAVKSRDKRCLTTQYNQGLISCRLVSKPEADWVC